MILLIRGSFLILKIWIQSRAAKLHGIYLIWHWVISFSYFLVVTTIALFNSLIFLKLKIIRIIINRNNCLIKYSIWNSFHFFFSLLFLSNPAFLSISFQNDFSGRENQPTFICCLKRFIKLKFKNYFFDWLFINQNFI